MKHCSNVDEIDHHFSNVGHNREANHSHSNQNEAAVGPWSGFKSSFEAIPNMQGAEGMSVCLKLRLQIEQMN